MGFKLKQVRSVSTLFGLAMDHATEQGIKNIKYYISRARRPKAPYKINTENIYLEQTFQEQCKNLGFNIVLLMQSREMTQEIITQANIVANDQIIVIVETIKTDPQPNDPRRIRLQARFSGTLSEIIIQQLIGRPLTELIEIAGPIAEILAIYNITAILSKQGQKGTSSVFAELRETKKC